ncbi:Cof-type HAD-IIB family hydrolase [Lacticaseibacillus camelliae]|uniref:Cof family hydrolase n=1 Tax=Lacticaseibacillus camelliae DSM 22697 = JCM 13995 TaxID=1423730 RepID=A0A0R2EYW2_9LACO|nr:Cof-type HAD-IIB family hydrolase [Lacticaseibacillus camelliae]KRN21503.1 cof family hydrolase [Lacticaseibacillus camelliae DSM 22697 = JCM 13995]
MKIRMIALDIDDTLLTSTRKILPSTKSAVQDAVARGIKVVLCTGRPLAGVTPYLTQLALTGDDQYVITYNGAVTESLAGRVVAKHLLDNAAYREITALGQRLNLPTNVLDEHSNIFTADRDVDWWIVEQAAENQAGLFIRDPDELPGDFAIAKGAYVGKESLLDQAEQAVRQALEDRFYVVRAGRNFIEIMDPHVNKGQALRDLARVLDLTPDEIMAVGDEGNDIAMFDVAGLPVAMGNGTAEAKAHAKVIAGTNDEGGLGEVIRQYALQ